MTDLLASAHPTRTIAVTFFEDRAQVTRQAQVSLVAGANTLTLRDLTALIDDPSLMVELDDAPGVELLAARVHRVMERAPTHDDALITQRDEAVQALDAAKRAIARADAAIARHHAATGATLDALSRAEVEDVAHITQDFEALDGALASALQAHQRAHEAAAEATSARDRAIAALDASQEREDALVALAQLQLRAERACEITLTLRYFTPCAMWRPAHLAQLLPADSGGHILRFATHAAIWQRTGERWEGIRCALSTARPSQAAQPPQLSDDVLQARYKSDYERRVIQVEARDQQIALTGLDGGARDNQEMPGVDDGGEPLRFEALELVTLPSDGQALQVQIDRVDLPAQVEVIATPERSEVAHLRARATWRGPAPLLAGPALLMRAQSLVGRGLVKLTTPGEALELGFGPEDALRIRRVVSREDSTHGLTRKRRQTYTVELFLSNLAGTPRTLTVQERIPVSEIEAVQVTLIDADGGELDARDGLVRYTLTVPARGHMGRTLRYRLDLSGQVSLNL